jgi:hypothetical protein
LGDRGGQLESKSHAVKSNGSRADLEAFKKWPFKVRLVRNECKVRIAIDRPHDICNHMRLHILGK